MKGVFEVLPGNVLNIIMEGTNVKIGKEQLFGSTMEIFSKHNETNENGQFLVDCAKEKSIIIIITS